MIKLKHFMFHLGIPFISISVMVDSKVQSTTVLDLLGCFLLPALKGEH